MWIGSNYFLLWIGTLLLCVFLIVHVWKDLSKPVSAWYFHSTLVWSLVMLLGTVVFLAKFASLKSRGVDTRKLFKELPE